jgi:hypothetical protein
MYYTMHLQVTAAVGGMVGFRSALRSHLFSSISLVPLMQSQRQNKSLLYWHMYILRQQHVNSSKV